MVTLRPRSTSSRPSDAEVMPFPKLETTPPVMKMYLVLIPLTPRLGPPADFRPPERPPPYPPPGPPAYPARPRRSSYRAPAGGAAPAARPLRGPWGAAPPTAAARRPNTHTRQHGGRSPRDGHTPEAAAYGRTRGPARVHPPPPSRDAGPRARGRPAAPLPSRYHPQAPTPAPGRRLPPRVR